MRRPPAPWHRPPAPASRAPAACAPLHTHAASAPAHTRPLAHTRTGPTRFQSPPLPPRLNFRQRLVPQRSGAPGTRAAARSSCDADGRRACAGGGPFTRGGLESVPTRNSCGDPFAHSAAGAWGGVAGCSGPLPRLAHFGSEGLAFGRSEAGAGAGPEGGQAGLGWGAPWHAHPGLARAPQHPPSWQQHHHHHHSQAGQAALGLACSADAALLGAGRCAGGAKAGANECLGSLSAEGPLVSVVCACPCV